MSLSKLYDDIVAKAKVNRSSREITDISSAVEEMLTRLISGEIEINYDDHFQKQTLKFHKVDLEPCGSMTEHTSLWKSTRRQFRQNTFLEYDYLAILQNEDNVVKIERGGRPGCREIYTGDERLWPGDEEVRAGDFNEAFLDALYSRIHSRCSCCVDPGDTSSEDDRHDSIQCVNATPTVLYCRIHGSRCSCCVDPDDTSSEDDRHDSRPCTECTVVRDTGYLQIAKIPDISRLNVKHSEHCSLVFYWTSRTNSLLAPNVETLQSTEKIKRLVIRVDLLPAFESLRNRDGDQCGIKRFIIAKRCPHCIGIGHFMVSYCMHEMNAIKHVSDQHRQSYIIIKFLYGQFIYWTGVETYSNSYHAKVAFLTHCQTCTDEQKDCTTCITEILQSLVEAYRSESLILPEFHPVENLTTEGYADGHRNLRFYSFDDDDRTAFQIPIFALLHVLSQLKSLNVNHQCNSQYRPSHVVGLIKRTCRMLCEQGRPGIVDVDGKSPNCLFSYN